MSKQNDRERLADHLQRGLITVDDANVKMIRDERFRIVHKLPRDVRKALNAAVKRGELGHMKRDGLKPEVYYHPTFRYMAIEARDRTFRTAIDALEKIYAP